MEFLLESNEAVMALSYLNERDDPWSCGGLMPQHSGMLEQRGVSGCRNILRVKGEGGDGEWERDLWKGNLEGEYHLNCKLK